MSIHLDFSEARFHFVDAEKLQSYSYSVGAFYSYGLEKYSSLQCVVLKFPASMTMFPGNVVTSNIWEHQVEECWPIIFRLFFFFHKSLYHLQELNTTKQAMSSPRSLHLFFLSETTLPSKYDWSNIPLWSCHAMTMLKIPVCTCRIMKNCV